jgi:DNA transposition AAA+ family ATPase
METMEQPRYANQIPAANQRVTPLKGLSVSGDTMVQSTKDLPEAHREAVRWLYFHATELGINSLTQVGELIKKDASTMHRIFTDRYRNSKGERVDLSGIVEAIIQYRALYEKRQEVTNTSFVMTSVARRVFEACELALKHQKIVFVFGESQIGKTAALEEFAKRHNGQARYVRMPEGGARGAMLKEMAEACRVTDTISVGELQRRVIRSIDKSNLIIVDELHQVFTSRQKNTVNTIELLREIWDRTKCGMVLCGTQIAEDNITMGKQRKLLQQLVKRSLVTARLGEHPPMKDLLAIAESLGLEKPEGYILQIIESIRKSRGISEFTSLLQLASVKAYKDQAPISWEHFLAARDAIKKYEMGEME